ncbi:TLC domain-containing protein [Cokeromyces recurvatus]|uniref:TLC domain-containing protein n=1 Tax=Cokeromyces recurvatus TaxID=90255 RepID=UPI0022206D9F|nr:TLC domain-containing protein [Cokeromyces recurvatus]KAI7899870.1 TLC domain-containing protein [Cokeromyces recurvatus]
MTSEPLSEIKKTSSSQQNRIKENLKHSKTLKQHVLDKELEISALFTLGVIIAFYLGSSFAKKCLTISYKVGENQYDKGYDDIYFVGYWVIAFTFLRAMAIKFVFYPIGKYFRITSFSKRQRFTEQAWSFSYYAIFWSIGMHIMYHSPHWFNTSQYWIDYPHILISKKMKIEKRKDHLAMMVHHFITIALIVSSYYTNFTRIGNAVLCCMDFADIFLPLAKALKYIGFTFVCDVTFGIFALSWPITRQVLFTMIIWATAVEPSQYIDMKWEPEKGKYFTPLTQKIYITLFVLLNIIMVYWFLMIVNVIIRVLRGKSAEDTRSDDEDEDDETM